MRICYFTPVFLPDVGGAEYVTDALAREFVKAGHEVHVLARGKRDCGGLGLPYPVTWYPKMRWPHVYPERVLKHLRRLHARERFDVFLVNYGRPTGIAAVRLTKRTGVPTVIVSHGGDLYRESEDRGRPHVFRRTVEAYREADAAIAISPHVEALIREVRPADRPLVCIPNGVDAAAMNAPAARPTDFTDQRPFLLCLGNLTEFKGFDDAVDAFALARPGLGEVTMVLVGQGKMRPVIERKIAEHGLGSHVHLLGQRTGDDKRWLMQHCRYGLMPSIEEGHPIVGLEFMAVGKPVVCSTNPSFDEMFTHGVNSLRVPAREPMVLAEAMRRMESMDFDAMGAVSRGRCGDFAWSAIAERYLEVMRAAIATREKR